MAETLMPHAIQFETESNFNARVMRQQYRPTAYGRTAIFSFNGRHCVVGEEALTKGRPVRITGPDKYHKGHLDVLLMAALQKLAPDGHPNVVLACAHTTDSVPYINRIAESVGGSHEVIRYDGKKVKYHVRAFVPFDEPAGGLIRFMTHDGSGSQAKLVQPGEKLLVIDVGGKVSTMIPAMVLDKMEVEPLWSQGVTFPVGIQDIIKVLAEEMRALYPDVFSTKSIPESILREAIMRRGYTSIRDDREVNVEDAYLSATGLLLTQLENVYVNDMDRGLEMRHIAITGGGGGTMFESLKAEVLQNDNTYLADYAESINFANLRGGEYALEKWVFQNADRLNKLVMKTGVAPLYMVFDPGNSDLKFKVMGDEVLQHGAK